ncbi:MAG: YciI family protein, partial [Gemmatimonadaceae bacterium]
VLVPANKQSEAGTLPTEAELIEMNTFNQELISAGVMLTGEGLHPTSKGARIDFTTASPSVIDGPFAASKELIAGFWMVQGKSLDEVVGRFKRAPKSLGRIEIRQVFSPEDFQPAIKTDAGRAVMDAEAEFRKRTNS